MQILANISIEIGQVFPQPLYRRIRDLWEPGSGFSVPLETWFKVSRSFEIQVQGMAFFWEPGSGLNVHLGTWFRVDH